MTTEQQQHIEAKIKSGFLLSSSLCLSAGFQIYKKHFFPFALYALLVPIISVIFSLSGLGLIGMLFVALFISPVLNAGLYLGAHQVVTNKCLEYSDFFKILPKSIPIISSNLLANILFVLILIPVYYIFENIGIFEWYQAVAENPVTPPEPPMMNGTQSTTFFLNIIPLIYLQVGFSWAFLLILFYDANPLSALELSRRLINKIWGVQFMILLTFASIFMLASILLSTIVAIHVGLANVVTMGLFLLFPWVYSSLYAGFRGALDL